MAKAKVLADRISITSTVLTDENIERVKLLAPSVLRLEDVVAGESTTLFEVACDECNSFTKYGAVFKGGKTLGNIDESIMELEADKKEVKIKNILTAALTKINAIEEQVSEYLENAEDLDADIEFLD